MKNLTPSQLKYFLLIVILIFGFFLVFEETKALELIPGGQNPEQNTQEQTKEGIIEQKAPPEQATSAASSPELKQKSSSERNSELIILLLMTAILIGTVSGTFIYFFGKRKK